VGLFLFYFKRGRCLKIWPTSPFLPAHARLSSQPTQMYFNPPVYVGIDRQHPHGHFLVICSRPPSTSYPCNWDIKRVSSMCRCIRFIPFCVRDIPGNFFLPRECRRENRESCNYNSIYFDKNRRAQNRVGARANAVFLITRKRAQLGGKLTQGNVGFNINEQLYSMSMF